MVGIGPGGKQDRTFRAEAAIVGSDCIVGYTTYLSFIQDLTQGKEVIATGMRKEVERCQVVLERAMAGKTVALVCSGDAGIYGMAGLLLQLAQAAKAPVPIEIIPGVTAASAAAALLGAPLMLDYATISLSDLLVPWDSIQRRLNAVADADMVTVLYNPKSKTRKTQLEEAVAIFRKYRQPATPVGIVSAAGSDEQEHLLTDLEHVLSADIHMRSVVVIGNSTSYISQGWFITPRGYKL